MAKFLFRKNHSTLSYSIYVALYWKPTIWGHRLGHNKKFLKWFQLFVHKYKYLTILSPFNSATFMWGFWIFNYLLRFCVRWLRAIWARKRKKHTCPRLTMYCTTLAFYTAANALLYFTDFLGPFYRPWETHEEQARPKQGPLWPQYRHWNKYLTKTAVRPTALLKI